MTPRTILRAAALATIGSAVAATGCIVTSEPIYLYEQCIPENPPPVYLWIGPAAEAPAFCPDTDYYLRVKTFEGHADLVPGAVTCPECTCGASETKCGVPTDWTVIARSCQEPPDATEVFFSAPDNWNGICSTQPTIAADLPCPGGEPCTQAMLAGAPTAEGAACTPMTAGNITKADPPWTWQTLALGCFEYPLEYCEGGDILAHKPPEGFLVCVERVGSSCPATFTELRTVYQAAEDERTCAPCTCAPPQDNLCTVKVTAYSDQACGTEAGSAFVSSTDGSVCFDVPDGTALASKRAEVVNATLGACTAEGGEPIGDVQAKGPIVFCCQPAP